MLREARTIAVVARSNRTSRPWHEVADYLIEAGYRVYLVNPLLDEALGRRCYDSVGELPERVDIVDVFRRVPEVPGVVEDAIEAGGGRDLAATCDRGRAGGGAGPRGGAAGGDGPLHEDRSRADACRSCRE